MRSIQSHKRCYIFLFLCIAMLLFAAPAFADSTVQYENQAEKFVFLPSDTDLFDNFKNVMPGDEITQDITVKNNSSTKVKIFLRAETAEAPAPETAVTMQDFLSQLSMTVKQGDKELFNASPDVLGGLANNVLLGEFASKQSTSLVVTLKVPIELGNEYANRTGKVDWVFTVEEIPSGGGGGAGGGSAPGTDDDRVPGDLNGEEHFAYVMGYPDGTVRPERDITRAEVVTIFHRLLTEEARTEYAATTNSFSDVKNRDWFNDAISTMANMGIVGGYPDGTFRPNAPITRAEFAAIAVRFDKIAESDNVPFTDIANHWAWKDIIAAASKGWVAGYEDGTFRPDRSITRAEVMAIVNRVLLRLPETTEDLLDGMIEWPDNADTTAWYYISVQEASNGHEYVHKADGIHEYWTVLNNEEEKKSFLDRVLSFLKK